MSLTDLFDKINSISPAGLIPAIPLNIDLDENEWELIRLIRKLQALLPNPILIRGIQSLDEYLIKYFNIHAESEDLTLLYKLMLPETARPKIPKDMRLAIERAQGSNCAICGSFLDSRAKSHIDHVFPLSRGGENDPSNYRALCADCNLGKGGLVHWVMGAPWSVWGEAEITSRLRYCTLVRYGSKCSHPGCTESAPDSQIRVSLIIPKHKGGRPIFDNLKLLCSEHYRLEQKVFERAIITIKLGA